MMTPSRPLWCTRGAHLWPLLLVGLYLAGLFLFTATLTRQPTSFNSDDLYCPSVCEDLLQKRDMQGWHFTAVPYVFPDLMLLLPCQALSTNLVVVILLYDFLFYSLLGASLAGVVRLVGLGWREAFLTACTAMLFLLAAHLDPAYISRAGEMYQPGFHVGAILSGVLLMVLVLHSLRSGVSARIAAALLAICPLAVFSDRLLIVEFIVPMLTGLCLLAVTRATPWRRLIVLGSLLGTGTLLAGGIQWCFLRMGLILMYLRMNSSPPHWKHVAPFFQHVLADMPNRFLLPLHLLAGLAVVLCWLRKRGATDARVAEPDRQPKAAGILNRPAVLFVASVATLSPLSNAAAVFLRNFDAPPARYLFACWLLPFLFLGLFVQMLPGWLRRQGGACFRLVVVLFAVYRIVAHGAAMDYTHFEPPYPPLAQTLDRLERERGPMRGLAGYWRARRMNFLSRERVWVRPASWNGYPWFHAYNPNRFLADDPTDLTLPRYNFIIISPTDETAPMREEVLIEFGEPVEKIVVDGDEVWLYERLSSPRFDRFLEAQLAQRICRREKYVAPVSPRILSRPKPNFMHYWSARNIQLKQGEDLEIHFDHPICGGLIDVAANFSDEYQLTFYRGEELLEELNVPTVPWTGAVFYYYPLPGIQSRLLRVPDSLRNRPWDRVVVRPVVSGPDSCDIWRSSRPRDHVVACPAASSTERSLGHFLIFDEDVARRIGCSDHP